LYAWLHWLRRSSTPRLPLLNRKFAITAPKVRRRRHPAPRFAITAAGAVAVAIGVGRARDS